MPCMELSINFLISNSPIMKSLAHRFSYLVLTPFILSLLFTSLLSGQAASSLFPDITEFKVEFPLDNNGNDYEGVSYNDRDDPHIKNDIEENLGGFVASSPFNQYFFVSGNELVMRAHCAGALTSVNAYPRCELRQQIGGNDTFWDYSEEHELNVTLRITEVPDLKQEVCVVQAKGTDTPSTTSGTEEALRVEYRNDGNSGWHLTVNESNGPSNVLDYSLGQTVHIRVYINNDQVFLEMENLDNGDTYSYNFNSDYSHGYFKTGAYTQSSIWGEKNGVGDEDADARSEVRFSQIELGEPTVVGGNCSTTVIADDNFNASWGFWNDGGSDCRRSTDDAAYSNGGSGASIRLRDNDPNNSETYTDDINAAEYSSIKVEFNYYPRSMDNSNEDFWLQVSTNGNNNSSYNTVASWARNTDFQNNQRYFESVTINGPFTNDTRLRFRCDASGNSDWVYIDDIKITGQCNASGGSNIVHITKRNSPGFAIDGSGNESDGQNVYLYAANSNNANQRWVEIDRGGGYYSYQKLNTDYCLDGQGNGTNGQNVHLWGCNESNQNQHFLKQSTSGGAFKLIKRSGGQNYAINGGSNGANGQNVNIYDASNSSYNLQWFINSVGTSNAPAPNPGSTNTTITSITDYAKSNSSIVEINDNKEALHNTVERTDMKPADQQNYLNVEELTIYPNPFNNEITITLTGASPSNQAAIEIFELASGTIVHNEKYAQSTIKLNDISLVPGTYVIKVTYPDGSVILKKAVKL